MVLFESITHLKNLLDQSTRGSLQFHNFMTHQYHLAVNFWWRISVTGSVYFWCHLYAFRLSPLAEYQIWSHPNAFLLLTKSLCSSKNLSINSDLCAFLSLPTKLWSSINLVIRCSTAVLWPWFLFKWACSIIVGLGDSK